MGGWRIHFRGKASDAHLPGPTGACRAGIVVPPTPVRVGEFVVSSLQEQELCRVAPLVGMHQGQPFQVGTPKLLGARLRTHPQNPVQAQEWVLPALLLSPRPLFLRLPARIPCDTVPFTPFFMKPAGGVPTTTGFAVPRSLRLPFLHTETT